MALDHDHDVDRQPTAIREQIQEVVDRPFTLPKEIDGLVNPEDIESFELSYNGNGAKIILRSWSKQKMVLQLANGIRDDTLIDSSPAEVKLKVIDGRGRR